MKAVQQVDVLAPRERALLREYKHLIQQLVPGATVLLYGSRARGTAGPESDWDILVLTDEPLSMAEHDAVRDALYELELAHEIVASLLFYSKSEWNDPLHQAMPLHEEIRREGIVL